MEQKTRPGPLQHIFGTLWKGLTYTRIATGNILFLAVIVIILLALQEQSPQPLPEKSALRLNPAGIVVDQKSYVDPLAAILGADQPGSGEVLLSDMVDAVRLATDDDRITSLVMELDFTPGMGTSKTSELANAIADFRAAGKPVIAWNDSFTQSQYLLATEADEIIIDPLGAVALEGFASYQWYLRDALEKLYINVHVYHAGEFKSLAESYLRDSMSPGEKVISQRWLDNAWQHYASTVETRRELPTGAVTEYINSTMERMLAVSGNASGMALQAGLVDQVLERRAADDYISEIVGATDENGYYEGIAFEDYLLRQRIAMPSFNSKPKVAVIAARGSVNFGEQVAGSIGSDTLGGLLQDAIDDDSVEAIVLRMDTGGGGTFAGELIRRKVEDVRAAGKPIVVSMGSVTASAGVWIASAADKIVATPTTLTGSIGVFLAFPTFEKLLNELGIAIDGVGTTSLAGTLRLDRDVSDEAAKVFQVGVDYTHDLFIDIVAQGRGLPREQVAAIADGRVFLGDRALELGLVDALGGLEEATVLAASLADLKEGDYTAVPYAPAPSPGEEFLKQLSGSAMQALGVERPALPSVLARIAAPILDSLRMLESFDDPRNLYAHCVNCVAP